MNGSTLAAGAQSEEIHPPTSIHGRDSRLWCGSFALFLGLLAGSAAAQVITIDSNGNAVNGKSFTVDRRFAPIHPTNVVLSKTELDTKTRLELIRVLQAEQGFAMRPFPRGHKGLNLVANGELVPSGEAYLAMVTDQGICANPGERLVITDIKVDRTRIVFDLNGGPDAKHRFLRHIQLGTGPVMTPVVQGDEQEATGGRLTLVFHDHLPELTGAQVKALLSPLISFDLKTPIEAYTDTLPPRLKQAILDHHVMVGMNTDMVLFAKGQPDRKVREVEEQTPFEEWIYGQPPKDVEFVRINGNRVIRVEVAKIGEPPVIFTKDEVEGMMRTDGTPLQEDKTVRTAKMGDVQRDPNSEAPSAPPSLRNPGETIPADQGASGRVGTMRPVQFPKPKPDDEQDTIPATQPAPSAPARTPAPAPASSGQAQSTPQPANAKPAPADSSQPAPSKPASNQDQPN